ncbi:rhomboid family intramembrane serine protease [Lusitaniella coriacea LEGE 07157]|uniref:Rhomboid family intramembrane serine protease n=1 Tax=Lusitaniella coriacea LEGE 07157 TaxID=945747 RepID=A0A8J7IUK0_9CYAN|nr:rhomboid family intramembrane serine protease [Lusitaniella coriacea]MBE9117662.1 rhomboid family intramembrane serine protease [Lusitaniella coriacea LEGE 07157]
MFKRQPTGSIACPSCRKLVAMEKKKCPHCGRRNPGMWGYARTFQRLGADLGFIEIATWGCIGLYLISLLMDIPGIHGTGMDILSPSPVSNLLLGSTGSIPVFLAGRWWTVLSSGWLHGSLIHIAFNVAWIRHLVPGVAQIYGGARLVVIYTASAIAGSLITSVAGQYLNGLPGIFHGASFSVGASGAIFGLFGALVAYGQVVKGSAIAQQAKIYAIVLFLFGFVFPNTDNWGHLGGFIGGYLAASSPWLTSRYREGHRHLIAAILCLLATALSFPVSVVHALFFLGY